MPGQEREHAARPQQMPGHRLHIQQTPLILRSTLHRKIIPNPEDQQAQPRGLFRALLAGEEAQLHGSVRIVDIRVDETYRLPSPELQPPVHDGHHDGRRDECRKDVVAAVSGRAMLMPPPAVPRQQLLEYGNQVDIAAGPRLEDGHAGCGVGHEHGEQTTGLVSDESGATVRQVDDRRAVASVDPERVGTHRTILHCVFRGTAGRSTCHSGGMQIGLLGPLEVRVNGVAVDVAGSRLRSLLTRLALDAGRPVSVGALVDAVWGAYPPGDQANALQSLVSRLRRSLGDAQAVQPSSAGYRLAADPGDVDVHQFERLAADGAAALRRGDPATARPMLRRALSLWRGPALADCADAAFAAAPIARLDDLRLAAMADRLAADLSLQRAPAVVAELEALTREHPLDERFAALLMKALRATGRTSDALAAYQRLRELLVDELGVDPSPELQELHLSVLRGEQPPRPAARPDMPGGPTCGPLSPASSAATRRRRASSNC